MMWTMSLALIALSLGGILDHSGFVQVLLKGILERIHRAATLMTATISAGIVGNMSMGEGYLSIIFGGQILSISPLEFAPWTFFNYLNPLLSIGLAYMGFGIFRKTQIPAKN